MTTKDLSESTAGWGPRLDEARRRLADGENDGRYADVLDELVRELGRAATWDRPGRALIALGGYGRRELAPRSDVDLLFLTERAGIPADVEGVLYPLWDLGFDVGHAIRTPADCAALADDLTVATALLDARVLLGEQAMLEDAKRRMGIAAGGSRRMRRWAAALIRDVEVRRARFGEVSQLLEPHLKEGRGGLRDLHACRWLVACLGQDPREWLAGRPDWERAMQGIAFVSRARNALHGAAGRKTDHLTFEYHREVSARAAPSRTTQAFFQELHRASHAIAALWDACERDATGRRARGRGMPWVRRREQTADLPTRLLAWTRAGGRFPEDLDRTLRDDSAQEFGPALVAVSKQILRSRLPLAPLLRELHRLGHLSAVAPEVDALTHHVQYDARHAYTTGVHCIETLGTFEDLWLGALESAEPHLTRIAAAVLEPAAARVAALCHDLGKDQPGSDHAAAGADVARRLAARLGLGAEETEQAVRLVRVHGSFPALVFGSDLEDPASWERLRGLAGDAPTLDALVALVYADLRATNPTAWTGVWSEWKRDLLLTAHARAFRADLARHEREHRTQRAVEAEASRLGVVDVAALWPRIPPREAAQVPADLLAQLLALGTSLGDGAGHWHVATRQRAVEVLGAVRPSKGMYARLFGALASAGLDILSFQAHTWSDGVVHVWVRARGEAPLPSVSALLATIERSESKAPRAVSPPTALVNRRREATPVAVRVELSDETNPFHSTLELQCRDRPGLLSEVVRALDELDLVLEYALVTTHGPAARDVFHLKDIFGGPVDREQKRRKLIETVTQIANGP